LNDSSDFDSTSLKIDDEEHEVSDQAESSEHFDAKEIGCGDDCGFSISVRRGIIEFFPYSILID